MEISDSELRKLTETIENKNLSIPQVIELIENNNVQDGETINTTGEIKLTVDYTKTVEQAVEQAIKQNRLVIDGKKFFTSENFPHPSGMTGKKVEIITKLFYFGCIMDFDDVLAEMDKDGYRPANLMELLALGVTYPMLQRHFSIIAFGSIWCDANNIVNSPALDLNFLSRCMSLYGVYTSTSRGCWLGTNRFLGVKK